MRVGSATHIIHDTAQIDDDVIVNADVNPAAGIIFSKLASGAIDAHLIPDTNVTWNLGSGTHGFLNGYVSKMDVQYFYNSLSPNTTTAQHIGDPTHIWDVIYVQDIQGAAEKQIRRAGLFGG